MLFSFPTEKILEKEQRRRFLLQLFRRVFLEDWGTKLIALGITIALWLGVTGLRAPVTQRITNVALNLSYSSEMEVTNSPITEVDIFVTGDKSKIDRLRREDLVVSIDLTEIKTGERTIQLTPENINIELPSGLKVEEIQPNKIAVRLERVEEREVPVNLDIEGKPAKGFEIYSRTISPPTVRVRGPESFVRALDSISTEKINIENQSESFTLRQIELNVVNPKVRLLDTVVDVTFNIGEERVGREYVVSYGNEGETVTAVRKALVTLYAPRSILDQINPESLRIQFVASENGETKPQLILPPEMQGRVEVRNIRLQ
jgi:Uncharacterized protein conserved in bacteria